MSDLVSPIALPITGGCHCGAVRYTIDAQPVAARACWCGFCQKIASGSATVNAFFPTEAVRIAGPLKTYVRIADSGNELHAGFCAKCGTDISTFAVVRPHLTGIRVGSLDDRAAVAPTAIIWTADAPAWAHFDPALPAYPGQMPA